MKKEELEDGKFYWVEWITGEIIPAKHYGNGCFGVEGSCAQFKLGRVIKRVICECVKPEVEG